MCTTPPGWRARWRSEARALSLSGRDIGPLPDVVDAERKASCARDFRAFCERYFPVTFHLAWSPDHLRVIAKIERRVRVEAQGRTVDE